MAENRTTKDGEPNLPDIRRRGFVWTLALTAVGKYATLGAADPRENRTNTDIGGFDTDLNQDLVEYANRAGRVNHEKLRKAHEDYDNGDIDKELLDRVILAWRTAERVVAKEVITLEEDIEAPTTLERNPNSNDGEAVVYQVPAYGTTLRVQAKLTIEPGVVIEFGPGVGIEVTEDGRIIAEGTASEPIFLTGTVPRRGSWNGVVLDGSDDPENRMAQMVIEYGGREGTAVGFKGPANVEIENGQTELRNCELRQSEGYGLALNRNSVLTNHEGDGSGSNIYLNNQLGPVNTAMDNVHTLSGDSTYTSDDPELRNDEEYVLTDSSADGEGIDEEERTMENLGVPYRVDGASISDVTWTIEPGTRLEFTEGTDFWISSGSRIFFQGTAEDPIVFTGVKERRGWWRGIELESGDAENVMEHVVVEYGGNDFGSQGLDGNLVLLGEAKLEMHDCTLRHSGGYGIDIRPENDYGNTTINGAENNVYTDNAEGPARVRTTDPDQLSGTSEFTGNDDDHVFVAARTVEDGEIDGNFTWPDLGVPYRMEGDEHEINDIEWTIEPGATLEFEKGGWLDLDPTCSISFEGEPDDPITFTGTREEPGWWHGIWVDSDSASNTLRHAVVEYAGRGFDGALRMTGGTAAHVEHCTFRHTQGYGLYTGKVNLEPDGTEMGENVYTDNSEGPVRTRIESANHLSDTSEFTGNGDDYVYVEGGSDVESSDIAGEYTWEGLEVPYRISGEESRFFDLDWAIEPGATLEFEESGRIDVRGSTFNLAGEDGDEITFTGTREQRGWWRGLRIGGSDADSNTLRHAVVEYAGNGQGGGLVLDGTTIHVEHCTFRRNDGYGLRVNDNVVVPGSKETANNVYTENSEGAVQFQKNSANFLSDTSQYTGNDDDHVYVNDAGIGRESVITWEAIEVPYRLKGHDHKISDYRMVIEPGATIEFEERGWLDFQGEGYFTIEGESDNKIRFTGTYDDDKDPYGWWGTLHVESDEESNTLKHAIIENGSSETNPAGRTAGTVILENGGEIEQMANCLVRKSRRGGLVVSDTSDANDDACAVNQFEDNLEDDCVFE